MNIQLSQEEARRFLATYHFTQSDLAGIFTRLGTVQYDSLNPVGRNADGISALKKYSISIGDGVANTGLANNRLLKRTLFL